MTLLLQHLCPYGRVEFGMAARLKSNKVMLHPLHLPRLPCCSQVILDTLDYSARIRKTPVVVGNCTGFAVNRVFFPYTMAACLLLDLGANPYQVDAIVAGALCAAHNFIKFFSKFNFNLIFDS